MMMMMCPLYISLLWSVCEGYFSDFSQPASFQAVKLGDTVTVTCRIHQASRMTVWYKLTADGRLKLVATIDRLYNMTTFQEPSHHFFVNPDKTHSQLIVSAAKWEDAGTYYCGELQLNDVQFGQGTTLMVKGAKMISNSVVQHPESQSVQSGDSVTLSCSVHSDQCAAEHTSVMWLKNSHQSAAEMIHSSGNNSCQRTEGGGTTCVYNLLMRNISSEEAGNYYCVVTSCERVLFGNGTTINIHREVVLTKSPDLSPAVITLMLSNIVLGVVTLLLVWTLYKNYKRDPTTSSTSSDQSPEENQTRDRVFYAAVCSAPTVSSCRSAPVKHNTDTVLYSDVRSL